MTSSDLERLEDRLHELEREVLKEQRFMHDFIERANLMVVGFDREARVTVFNRKAEVVTGYAKEDIVGLTLDKAFPPGEGNTIHMLADNFHICGGSGFRCETQLVTQAGVAKTVVWHASCLSDGDDLVGLMAFGEDQTVQRQYEERQRWFAAMHMLQKFSAKLAHGLNSLLGTILGYASLLHAQSSDGSTEQEHAGRIEEGVERCATVLKRLLDFGRGGAPKPRPFELGAVVERAAEALRSELPSAITIECAPADEAIDVMADPAQLEQVVTEAVRNAAEAMPEGGHVVISTEALFADPGLCVERPSLRQGWYGVVTVTDSGPGVLPEDSLSLFEPFSTSKQERWAGLGLAVAYGIMRRNGGWIELTGTPGEGTTATLYLPLVASGAEERPSEEAARTGPQTILLVDDEKALLDTVSDMLKHLGYLVLTAGDGEEAVRIYEEHRKNVDLIILDMLMPRKGGREAYDDLKRIQPDVKVLLTSGFEHQKAVAEDMCEQGAAGFVEKPYRLRDLSELIRRAIKPKS